MGEEFQTAQGMVKEEVTIECAKRCNISPMLQWIDFQP